MKAQKLFCRWRQRYAKLLAELPGSLRRCRLQGTPDQIHQLRVLIRRLRLHIRVGRPMLDKNAIKTYRKWSRAIARATSEIRDLDVTVDWIARQPPSEPNVAALQCQRDQLCQTIKAKLRPLPLPLVRELAEIRSETKAITRLQKVCVSLRERLQDEIARTIPIFFALKRGTRHEFRRALRRWRYLRELFLPSRKRTEDPILKHLVLVQEALGEQQNRLVASAILKKLEDSEPVVQLRRALADEKKLWPAKVQETFRGLQPIFEQAKWD